MKIKYVLIAVVFAGLSSCMSIKEYQKMFLNDKDMNTSANSVEYYEQNFQTYREGVSGGNSSKTGGGCGCN